MTWLVVYASVSVAVLAALSVYCARNLHGHAFRLPAITAAAALWPVLVVGLLQFGAFRLFAGYLGRRPDATPAPVVVVEAEPATVPMDLMDSLARVAQQIGATRHA